MRGRGAGWHPADQVSGSGPEGSTVAVFPVTRNREGNRDALGVNLQKHKEHL